MQTSHTRKLKLLLSFLCFFWSLDSYAQDSTYFSTPDGHLDTVIDNYGNRYGLYEIALDDTMRAHATHSSIQPLVVSGCSSGYFQLFLAPGCGMENFSTDATHQARLDVVCQMLNDVSNLINSPLTSTGQKVNIWVRDIDDITTNPLVLGLATSFYNAPASNTLSGIIDNTSWITIQSGQDAYTNVANPLITLGGMYSSFGTYFHGMMAFNFVDITNWHLNMNTATGSGDYDLYTVALHEMLHALGFASLINDNGGSKLGNSFNYYSRYDRNLFRDLGTSVEPLIKHTGTCSLYDYIWNTALPLTTLFPDASNCIVNHSECSTAVEYHGGLTTPQDVYTPNCFEPASSLSHFEDECAVSAGSDDQYFVMSNAQNTGPTFMKRYPKPEEKQVLCDIGYNVNTTYGNNTTAYDSYYNYGGSSCPGVQVAGINDGINNGIYVFSSTGGPVIINDAFGTYKFMGNDYNVTGFECLEDITDNTPGTFAMSGTGVNDVVTYTPPTGVFGVRLLRYIPVNGTEHGNITYIYVDVPFNNCVGDPCNMVMNGSMEDATGFGEIMGPNVINCWRVYTISPDLFTRNCNDMFYDIPTNYSVPASEVRPYSTMPNDHFLGLCCARYPNTNLPIVSEAMQTVLASPIVAGPTYRLRFWAKVANTFQINNTPLTAHLEIAGSPTTLVQNNTFYTSLPVGLTPLTTANIPDDNDWHFFDLNFVSASTVSLDNLIIINPGYMMPLPGMFFTQSYVYIDDVVLDVNTATFATPSPMTTCDPPLDLSTLVSVPGGSFLGYGVSGNFFDPLAALTTSLANNEGNMIHVIYQYTDMSGCLQELAIEIEILNGNTNLAIIAPANACEGGTFNLAASGGAPGTNYVWTPSVTCLNPPCSTATAVITVPTTFLVSNTDGFGCTSVVSATVGVFPQVLTASANPQVACSGQPITLSSQNGVANWNWTPSIGVTNPTQPTTNANPVPGVTTYTITATDFFGCNSSASVTVLNPYEMPCSPCTYGVPFNLIGDNAGHVNGDVNPGNYFVYQDLVIQSSSVWTDAVVSIAPGVKITVTPGATLDLNHSHLFSCQMWDGIYVPGNTLTTARLVVRESSFIEDADTAIRLDQGVHPIGVTDMLLAENSIFNKNLTGIAIQNNYNSGPAYGYTIRGNVFTSRQMTDPTFQNYPFTWCDIAAGPDAPRQWWYPGNDYDPPVNIDNNMYYIYTPCNNGQDAFYGVKLHNVGSNFGINEAVIGETAPPWESVVTNTRLNVFDNLHYGIYADKANVTSLNNTFMHLHGVLGSGLPGAGTGIYARSDLSFYKRLRVYNQNTTTQGRNRFYGCQYGVETRDYDEVQGRNTLMVSSHDISNFPLSDGNFGFYSRSARYPRYEFVDNNITNIDQGITFLATVNGTAQSGGKISILNNTIQAAYLTPTTQGLSHAIWVENLISCLGCPGVNLYGYTRIDNNNIRNATRGISASNFTQQSVYTLNNDVTLELVNGFNQFGIKHSFCDYSRIIQNEIAGEDFTQNIPNYRGIQVGGCQNSLVHCNYTFNTPIGIEFDFLNANMNWRWNEMRNHRNGMLLNFAGNIGAQGNLMDAMRNSWTIDFPFTWTGLNYHTFVQNTSPSGTSPLYTLAGIPEEPLNNDGIPSGDAYILGSTYFNNATAAGSSPCQAFNYIELDQIPGGGDEGGDDEGGGGAGGHERGYYPVAKDEISYDAEQERITFSNQLKTYRNLLVDSSLTDTSAVLQEFKAIAAGTRYDYIAQMETEAANGEYAAAEGLIADDNAATAAGTITGSNDVVVVDDPAADNIVENYRSFYGIYMRYMKDSLISTDTATVLALAEDCPITAGDVVFQARALYNAITRKMLVFNDSCVLDTTGYANRTEPERRKYGKKPALLAQQAASAQAYSVSPNPSSDGNFVLQQQLADEKPVQLRIYNAASQEVYKDELRFSNKIVRVHTRYMKPGLYLLRLTDGTGKTWSLKLTIL